MFFSALLLKDMIEHRERDICIYIYIYLHKDIHTYIYTYMYVFGATRVSILRLSAKDGPCNSKVAAGHHFDG